MGILTVTNQSLPAEDERITNATIHNNCWLRNNLGFFVIELQMDSSFKYDLIQMLLGHFKCQGKVMINDQNGSSEARRDFAKLVNAGQ